MIGILVGLVFIDQLVKKIVVRLGLRFIFNQGGAFGLGNNLVWFGHLAWLIGIILTIYFWQHRFDFVKKEKLGLILVLSGTWGNLIDRLFYPGPIDYLDFNCWLNFGNLRLPVFNLADIFLVVGVFWLIYLNIILKNKN